MLLTLHGFRGALGSPNLTLLAPGTQQIYRAKVQQQQGNAFMQGDISRSDPKHSLHWESSAALGSASWRAAEWDLSTRAVHRNHQQKGLWCSALTGLLTVKLSQVPKATLIF